MTFAATEDVTFRQTTTTNRSERLPLNLLCAAMPVEYLQPSIRRWTGMWNTSINNLVKQWHSIDSVLTLMETTSQQLNNVSYSRAGMFRYILTPIDIASLDTLWKTSNE